MSFERTRVWHITGEDIGKEAIQVGYTGRIMAVIS